MAAKNTHMLIGGVVGCVAYTISKLIKKENLKGAEFCGAILVGMVGGILTDILEPAIRNPNHREFFHSAGFGVLLIGIAKWVVKNNHFTDFQKGMINSFVAAYVSHLGLDAITPKGLPCV